jgi:hypothetical protein
MMEVSHVRIFARPYTPAWEMGLFVKLSGSAGYAYGFAVFLILAAIGLLFLQALMRACASETAAKSVST